MTMENRVNDDDKSCVGQESSQLTIVPEDIRADLEWLAKQMSIIGANRQEIISRVNERHGGTSSQEISLR